MAGKQPERGDVAMVSTGMTPNSARHRPKGMKSVYPPEVFDLMTDILAELLLEDLKQFPHIPTTSHIDSFDQGENTVLHHSQKGEE